MVNQVRAQACKLAVWALLSLPAAASELARLPANTPLPPGLRQIERYDRFQLVSGETTAFNALRAAGITPEPLPNGYRLALPGATAADPQQREPWNRQERRAFAAGEVYALQFHGPSKAEWLQALRADGITPVQYLHPYTYLVWNGSGKLGLHAATASVVRWVGEYPISARLALPPAVISTDSLQRVRLLVYRGAALDPAALAQSGAVLQGRAVIDAVMEDWLVSVPGTAASRLAQLPGVLSIQQVRTEGSPRGELSDQHFAGNVGADHLPLPDYRGWLNEIGFDGQGILIANVDGGLDQSHPNLIARMRPCSGPTCGGPAVSAHGTHTAGIMAADGSNGVRDSNGFLRGLGVAPAATLIEQIWMPFYQQAGGMLLLMRESAANGAYLSGNSWGPAPAPLGYDADTRQVDVGTRDTDPVTPGDQPLLFVLSIQNGGGGISTQGTPDEAKNVLTVGSTLSQNFSGAPMIQWTSLSSNSGHGPALDGRLIPQLVAPGCRTDSTIQGGVHGLMCGTSMASPHVSGAMALFAQAYRARHARLPSPAMARAFAIAATVDLFGGTDADGQPLSRRPNPQQGFGALRGRHMFANWPRTRSLDQTEVFTATGQMWRDTWTVQQPDAPLQVALAWTDAPGHGLCNSPTCTTPAWNNDLDLVVEIGGESYKGNVFGSDGFSAAGAARNVMQEQASAAGNQTQKQARAAGNQTQKQARAAGNQMQKQAPGDADSRNNIELVSLPPGSSGPLTIRVLAQDLNSDALPNSPGAIEQDFALVCSNCRRPGSFSLSTPGTPIGVCAGQDAAAVDLTLTSLDNTPEAVLLSTFNAPAAFGEASFTPNPVIPGAAGTSTSLVVAIRADASPGTQVLPIRGDNPAGPVLAEVVYEVRNAGPIALLAPEDGASGVTTNVALSWAPVPHAQTYRVEVARTADFEAPTAVLHVSGTSVVPTPALRANTTYHWRVRAESACGSGAYTTRTFTTAGGADALFSDGFPE